MPRTTFRLPGGLVALDARPDRLDLRDRAYLPGVSSLPPEHPPHDDVQRLLPEYLKHDLVLNQGSEGACTGFGLAGVVNYLSWMRTRESVVVSPRMLYHLARFYDEWPGEDYSGSSCRGALKGWHKHGVCARRLWPYTVDARGGALPYEPPLPGWAEDAVERPLGTYYRVDRHSVTDMQAALVEIGALYVSADVHAGWSLKPLPKKLATKPFADYRELPVIEYRATPEGGHAFALVGYTRHGFVVQNSWGPTWGRLGFAILTYEDWIAHGTDCWVAALGVPIASGGLPRVARTKATPSTQFGLSAGPELQARRTGVSLLEGAQTLYSRSGKPFFACLSTAGAYNQSIVLGNDGALVNRIVDVADAIHGVGRVVHERAADWFASAEAEGRRRVAIYAHGGLNSEQASVDRIRVMAPYFLANGIYPVFISWKTGWAETLGDLIADKLKHIAPWATGIADVFGKLRDKAAEVADRTIEALAADVGVKLQWVQMKQNALAGAGPEMPLRGLCALAQSLGRLQRDAPIELHLVGHSAGAIVHGHLLRLLGEQGLGVRTCSLYAPACSIEFASLTYRAAVEHELLARGDLHIHLMSDARELGDDVGKVYNKSLLYLVSRALETAHKTPLLGMAGAFDGARIDAAAADEHWNAASLDGLRDWNAFWWNGAVPRDFAADGRGLTDAQAKTLHIENRVQVSNGPRRIPTAHGSFDNDVDVVGATLERIRGSALKQKVVNLDV